MEIRGAILQFHLFIDYDVSWDPKDLLTLIQAEGDVIAGTYRYKKEEEGYMGTSAPSVVNYDKRASGR